MKRILLSLLATFALSHAWAQLFWNPTQANPYVSPGPGGNGDWDNGAGYFWDGANNIQPATDPGDYFVFEGSGDVGGGTAQPQRVEFQNVTGNYNLNFNLELRLSGTHAVHVRDGASDIYLQSLGYSAGSASNRSVRNDGSGTVTINTVLRRFGGGDTSLGLVGNGNFQINGAQNMGGTLSKDGTGDVVVNGNMNNFTAGIELNDGSLWMDNSGTSLLWNDGSIRADLDEGTFTSNVISLAGGDNNGAFTKGSGTDFLFDFQNFNATTQGTYTLVNFTSTDFVAGDFSASNITYDTGLSGSFTVNANSLEFSVIPEPSTLMLVGLTGFAAVLHLRRRR